MAHETSEQTFDLSDYLEREVRDCMPEAIYRIANLVAHERPKIDVFYNELKSLDPLVEVAPLLGEEADTVSRFMPSHRDKPGEKSEAYDDEDERCHGS